MRRPLIQDFFYLIFSSYFGVGLHTYFSNYSPFMREHIFVGFNKLSTLVYGYTVITGHRGLLSLFQSIRWDFMCVHCDVCTDTGPPVLSPIQEDKPKVMYS